MHYKDLLGIKIILNKMFEGYENILKAKEDED